MDNKIELEEFNKIGKGKTFNIKTNFNEICRLVFPPNVTHLDDPSVVEASWGIKDTKTDRKLFIWCYNIGKNECLVWSADGDISLADDIFGVGRRI